MIMHVMRNTHMNERGTSYRGSRWQPNSPGASDLAGISSNCTKCPCRSMVAGMFCPSLACSIPKSHTVKICLCSRLRVLGP